MMLFVRRALCGSSLFFLFFFLLEGEEGRLFFLYDSSPLLSSLFFSSFSRKKKVGRKSPDLFARDTLKASSSLLLLVQREIEVAYFVMRPPHRLWKFIQKPLAGAGNERKKTGGEFNFQNVIFSLSSLLPDEIKFFFPRDIVNSAEVKTQNYHALRIKPGRA